MRVGATNVLDVVDVVGHVVPLQPLHLVEVALAGERTGVVRQRQRIVEAVPAVVGVGRCCTHKHVF